MLAIPDYETGQLDISNVEKAEAGQDMTYMEDPRQTGRLAAYRFLLGVQIGDLDRTRSRQVKAVIRRALRGDLLTLNQTYKSSDRPQYDPWPLPRSLGGDLGGFGEGLKEGLEEILALVQKRFPDDP